MYPISPLFADYLKKHEREFLVKAVVASEEYTNASIVEFQIENSLTLSDGFEIGTAIPNKLTIKLRTITSIPANARVVPYLAASTAGLTWDQAVYPWPSMEVPWTGGSTEWLPLGEFFVDRREKVNDVWTFTCYDKLITADVAYISQLSYPASMKAVWDEICNRLGFSYDSSVVINPSYNIEVGPAGYTCRQIMAYIAGANAASVFVGKDGVIRFKRFAANAPAVFDMTAADYIRVKQTNPAKSYSRVVVTYNSEDQLTYEAGTGGETQSLNMENPFMTQTMVNNLQAVLNGFSYLPITMNARGFPQLDQGDVISFIQFEGKSWLDATIPWNDAHVPWDGNTQYNTIILRQVLSFKGGLTLNIDTPSVSDQQSEFALEGSLTQQVNKLDKTAVKEGKRYYGATITRKEGIVIERDDHASKAVFNSDELSFYAGSERALWFDLPSRKFKFTGTLEGVDGKFTGIIEGGKFIGGSIQIGSNFSVNNAGLMTAVGADFSGTITASVIEGGRINGTYISGADILGGKIRTATSGERIELDPYGFIFYDSGNAKRVALGTNSLANISGHTYYNASSSAQGLVYAQNNEFHVIGNSDIRVGTNSGGTVYLQGPVKFTNGQVSGLNLGIGDITGLQNQLESIKSDITSLRTELRNHTHTVNIGTHNHGNNQNQNWGGTFTTSTP